MRYKPSGILIIFLVLMAIVLVYGTSRFLWKETGLTYHFQGPRNYRFHFVMITQATDDGYWNQVHAGAQMVADSKNVALEYFESSFSDLKELERFLELSILYSVDGILISVPKDPNFKALINEAGQKGIPVVALIR